VEELNEEYCGEPRLELVGEEKIGSSLRQVTRVRNLHVFWTVAAHDAKSIHYFLLNVCHKRGVLGRPKKSFVKEIEGAQFFVARVLFAALDDHFHVVNQYL